MRRNEIKKIKIKKLFEGYASVRSYIVYEAKKKQIPLVIQFGDEEMTISPSTLDQGRMNTKKFFMSKWGDQPYCLIDFVWKAKKQLSLI